MVDWGMDVQPAPPLTRLIRAIDAAVTASFQANPWDAAVAEKKRWTLNHAIASMHEVCARRRFPTSLIEFCVSNNPEPWGAPSPDETRVIGWGLKADGWVMTLELESNGQPRPGWWESRDARLAALGSNGRFETGLSLPYRVARRVPPTQAPHQKRAMVQSLGLHLDREWAAATAADLDTSLPSGVTPSRRSRM